MRYWMKKTDGKVVDEWGKEHDEYKKVYYDDSHWIGEIHFQNNEQIAMWELFILGHLSDGYWENSNVDWGFWHELRPIISEQKGWIANRVPTGGMSLWLGEMLEMDCYDELIERAAAGRIGITDDEEYKVIEYIDGKYGTPADSDGAIQRLTEKFGSPEKAFSAWCNVEKPTHEEIDQWLDYMSEVMGTSIRKIGFVD